MTGEKVKVTICWLDGMNQEHGRTVTRTLREMPAAFATDWAKMGYTHCVWYNGGIVPVNQTIAGVWYAELDDGKRRDAERRAA